MSGLKIFAATQYVDRITHDPQAALFDDLNAPVSKLFLESEDSQPRWPLVP